MVAFGDLSTAAGLGKLNNHLKTRSYVEGYSFSDADRNTFAQLGGLPDADSFPYAYRWGLHIAALVGVRGVNFSGSAVAAAPAAKGKGKKPAAKPAKADDDDMDLFGDEEEAKPAEPSMSLKERAAALKAKKKEDAKVERSQIVFEVKPADTEIDLNQLFKTITSRVVDGLNWGEGYELKPVAYGINKLVMSCVIVDDKVLLDDIFEPIEAMEDEVQSVDMLTMNKI